MWWPHSISFLWNQQPFMHIAIVTAGGAGMFCGSCMHDNTWARALLRAGHEVSLIPTYTPIRVDETDLSLGQVFMGGINVYLSDRWKFWTKLPRFARKWLDSPAVIRALTKRAVSNDASELGPLTLSMLQGEHGPHREAIIELDNFISTELRPDVVIFSNALLAGAVEELKRRFQGPVLCMLQGDDVFLDGLSEQYRRQVIELVSEKSQRFDGFVTHTRFYRDYMSQYLRLPRDKFSQIPLGIDCTEQTGTPELRGASPLTIGYFARIAPEKGLHNLIEAFVLLKRQLPEAQLKIGGDLRSQNRAYFEECLAAAGNVRDGITYVGSPKSLSEKVAFLSSVDLLSVPTQFLEPKGLYVLEALANGTPVVQPGHGAFPEILEATQGGLIVDPLNAQALADGLLQLADGSQRQQFAQQGWERVREVYSDDAMARATVELLTQMLPPTSAS